MGFCVTSCTPCKVHYVVLTLSLLSLSWRARFVTPARDELQQRGIVCTQRVQEDDARMVREVRVNRKEH